jgi:hypothetical protein
MALMLVHVLAAPYYCNRVTFSKRLCLYTGGDRKSSVFFTGSFSIWENLLKMNQYLILNILKELPCFNLMLFTRKLKSYFVCYLVYNDDIRVDPLFATTSPGSS